MKLKPLIIGIDPGTTVAYAILDLKGNIVKIDSSKEFDLNNLIKNIFDFGNPIIIGTDKKNVPNLIEKFCAKFNARLILPKNDLLVSEKKEMIKNINAKTRNTHEDDALASALFAYSNFRNLFEKIEKHLKEIKKDYLAERIKTIVVKRGISIDKAVNIIEQREGIRKLEKNPKNSLNFGAQKISKEIFSGIVDEKKDLRLILKDDKEIDNLKNMIFYLEDKIKKLNSRINELEKINNILNKKAEGKVIYKEDKSIYGKLNELREKLQELEKINNENGVLRKFISDIDGRIIVKKLRNLGEKEFYEKEFLEIKERDILLVDDPNIRNEKVINAIKGKVSIIITKTRTRNRDFIYVDAKSLKLSEINDFALVNETELKKIIDGKSIFEKVLDEYKKERHSD